MIASPGQAWYSRGSLRQAPFHGLRLRISQRALTTAVVSALLLVYASWQLFRWGPAADRGLIADVFFYLVTGVAIGTAYSASRRCRPSPRLTRAWRLFALSLLGQLAGQVAFQVYDLLGKTPYPSIADGLYLSFYPLMLLGLLSLSVSTQGGASDIRLGIDLAVVAIAGSALVIYVVLGPTLVANSGSPLQVGFSVAYPVGDMILLVGLASLLLRGSAPSAHSALRLLAAGLLLFVVGDLVYGYMSLHSSYQSGDAVDATWMVALAVMAVAGTTQRAVAGPEPSERLKTRVSWLPSVAVAFGFGVLVFANREDAVFPGLVMIAIAITLAGLVLARQVLVQRDLILAQAKLRHQAFHDGLTGLPNRVLVLDRAEQMLARARREPHDVAALFIDIDGFKDVNDSLGHAVGDRLLQTIAGRLRAIVREGDTVGRFGGDEFVVLLDAGALDVSPEIVAERMLMAARDPIELDGLQGAELKISLSIGITIGPHDTADALLHDADIALYRAKESGKDAYVVFEAKARAVQRY
jgi:diguanylate cyclase (GGDEF)-like protein